MSRISCGSLAVLVVVIALVAASLVGARLWYGSHRVTVSANFANANGIYPGDEIRILGVAVGTVDRIEPQPEHVRITFSVDSKYKIPADAKAAILSPSLVSARAIQLVPAYSGGPQLEDGAVIPIKRTAVPVEWDDFRAQMQKLADSMTPTAPGEPSAFGSFIDTAADNVRGRGTGVGATLTKLANAMSILGDKSADIYSTITNLQTFIAALASSSDLMAQLNRDLAAVTTALDNQPGALGQAIVDTDVAVDDIHGFLTDNSDALGTTVEQVNSIVAALQESSGDLKQLLHAAPTAYQNFVNIYQPAQGALTGMLAFNNAANPIQFICGAIEAASQKGAKESARLCAQYLGPVLKNLVVNMPPVGENVVTGAVARPDEITYSEDRLRPGAPPTPADIAGMLAPTGGRR
ncbi:MCE family protein [Nocardia sp. NPDC050630]|uniref:MCE family protein n=1 Tax=Nocardia sp. NPDC050630 TaxID=3364321 RepID=UPI0037B5C522